jgi:hypothetical protein
MPVTSSQSGFTDVLDWLSFLTARDYLEQLLVITHGVPPQDTVKRCAQIIPHVRSAAAYIRQSLEGPPEISFLPAYYAILNLMKVYVLLGPRHADLAKNRWHGATYDPQGKDSRSVLTEEIVVKSGGVFPLFYETLTGRKFRQTSIRLRVGDFLNSVSGVWFEYNLATGQHPGHCQLKFELQAIGGKNRLKCLVATPIPVPKGRLQCMGSFRQDPANKNIYIGPLVANQAVPTVINAIRAGIRTELLYRVEPKKTYAMMTRAKILLPQELPIAFLFFYMSSVVRYRPEYFARLRDSKFWPVISSARLHSFLDFLLAFWSFAHKKNFFINAPLYAEE